MPVAVAVWSLVVRPGEPQSVIPQGDLVITNAALGDELQDETGRTTIKFTYARPVSVDDSDDEEEGDSESGNLATTVLCSLIPGKIEQATVNVTLEEDEEFLFEAVGKNAVYLTGNYIDQAPDNVPFNDDTEPEDEDGFDLREVSSDVQIDPAELEVPSDDDADRFEEIEEKVEAKKSAKRPRDSDVMEIDGTAEGKLSKSQLKKAKKLKAESGAAVPSGSDDKPDTKAAGEVKKEKKDKKEKKEASKTGKDAGDATPLKELPGGLKVQDIKVGTGPQAKKGNTVSMRYIGKLQNGKVFDSNTKGKPFTFKLGHAQVIKGWDQGILGMHVGGERLLIVPPNMAYGNKKNDPIPANSTLRFECKLIEIK